ncbi:MAG: chemotaxis response regulator protein-glutamate methylesterase [Verrucomicrobiales bacterium]|nr:chemotaxis response regulator protein-glutamate methylesterase [Verrucomicrobiales bacterium]
MGRVRTLIVDDSALVRKLLTEGLSHHPDIEVIGTAVDPYVARDKILALDPDVITLDIEMPRMDGLTFLKLIMKHRPMPVVIMSSLTTSGSCKALEALQSGAVEVVAKPAGAFSVGDVEELATKIRAAAQSRQRRRPGTVPVPAAIPQADLAPPVARAVAPPELRPVAKPVISGGGRRYSSRQLIVMGASTGGTEALKTVLTRLPADVPGICVVQHIPAYFSAAFAERLNQLCSLEVREAKRGDEVRPGLVLVAPGGQHMLLRWTGSGYSVDLNSGPPVHHQRPAVDVLFDTAVKAGAGPTALAVLLTGMGADGAAGMLRLREAGAETVAQDEQSCVVFGMPREAIRLGAARDVLPLDQMAARIDRYAERCALRAVNAAARTAEALK